MDPRVPAPPRRFAAVIVAAGKGLRAGGGVPKQFATWRGKPLVRHCAEALVAAGASPVVVAIPEGFEEIAAKALAGLAGIEFVAGGATRQGSVRAALEALALISPTRVLIHDAARPVLPQPVIDRLLSALEGHAAAVPVLPLVDSIAEAEGDRMAAPADRHALRRVQTPQAFQFQPILAAHRAWAGEAEAGDDAQVALAAGMEVHMVAGEESLRKITFPEDMRERFPTMRIGTGFDVHKLCEGRPLWLCGVQVPHTHGLAGHSDADVAIHALVDAVLGAVGEGDIGAHFPPSDPQWEGVSSDRFLDHAATVARRAGYAIGNVDVTIICEAPRIGPHRAAMRSRLAQIMGIDISAVSVKATTTEQLGFTGRREGIAAQAMATVFRLDATEQYL